MELLLFGNITQSMRGDLKSGGTHQQDRQSYIEGLDGLRALAVVSVFIGHCYPTIFLSAVGVDIFFALSGFLITRGLLFSLESFGSLDLVVFYIRRIARLFPAFLLMTIVVTIIQLIMPRSISGDIFNTLRSDMLALFYVMNWNRAFEIYPEGVLGHTWSLSIEEQFYLLWPPLLWAVFAIGGRSAALIIAIGLALISVCLRLAMYADGYSIMRLYNGFDVRADGLLIGCILALWRPQELAKVAGRWCLIPFIPIAIFLCYPWVAAYTLSSTICALASAWLILVLWYQCNARLEAVLATRWLRYLGRISYGLYLWHYPVILLLRAYHPGLRGWQVMIVAGALTMVASALSFHLVERPIIAFAHRQRRPSTGTPAAFSA